MKPRSFRRFLALLTMLSSTGGLVMNVSGASFPPYEFKMRVGNEDYLAFTKTLDQSRLDLALMERAKYPAYATEISAVKAGGQAEQNGVQKGWLLVSADGLPYWNRRVTHLNNTKENAKRELVFYTPESERKEVTIGPGLLGIGFENFRRPELYYFRNSKRGPWDRHIMVGIMAWQSGRFDIAQTAFYWASKKGLKPDKFTSYYAALLALEVGDYDTSRKLTKFLAEDFGTNPVPYFFLVGLRTLAFTHHDWNLLESATEANESLFPGFLVQKSDLAPWKSWRPRSASLATYLTKRGSKNVTRKITGINDDWSNRIWQFFKPDKLRDGSHRDAIAPAHYNAWYFSTPEGLRDVAFNLHFAFGGPAGHRRPASFRFILVDRHGKMLKTPEDRKRSQKRYICSFTAIVNEAGGSEVYIESRSSANLTLQRSLPLMTNAEVSQLAKHVKKNRNKKWMPAIPNQVHFSMIRIGTEMQLSIDGMEWVHIPVDPAIEEVGIFLQFVGASYSIDSMSVLAINPRR